MIRLGVIGTGRIAGRFMQDIDLVSEIQAVCTYNPHIESARIFAEKNHIGLATDDWNQLLACVDAVYIASPHHTHADYARRALIDNKHVLCEKPMTFSRSEAEELFGLATQKHLVLMEAIKTAYCPGFQKLVEVAQSGKLGNIRDVEACFTKLTDPAGRELTDPIYGGSLIELGTYVLLPIVKIFGTTPKDMQFQSMKDEKGIDLFTKVNVCYEQGFGLGKIGLGVKSEGELIISGTKGYIYAKAPWWLTKEFEVRYEDPNRREIYTFEYERSGLQYELQVFANEIQRDIAERGTQLRLKPEESIWIAGVMECYMKSYH